MKIRHADDSLTVTSSIGSLAALSGSMVLTDTLEFTAVPTGPAVRSRMIAERTEMPTTIPVVFIPQNVTLTSGSFSGSTIGVDMVAATAPCSASGDQCRNGFYGTAFSSGVKRWPSFPISVTIEASLDSARIWDALRGMESAVGQKMFVLDDGTHFNRIDVKVGLPPGVGGFTGYTTWTWDAQDRMTFATVWLNGTASRGLVQHEFFHALGFWHTCSWPSVMGGYGCPQASEVTSTDIAYMSLASAVYDAESGFRMPSGQLPCGLMSIWAAIPNQTVTARCFENNSVLPNTIIRQESAP
jgi:hypothetical protein